MEQNNATAAKHESPLNPKDYPQYFYDALQKNHEEPINGNDIQAVPLLALTDGNFIDADDKSNFGAKDYLNKKFTITQINQEWETRKKISKDAGQGFEDFFYLEAYRRFCDAEGKPYKEKYANLTYPQHQQTEFKADVDKQFENAINDGVKQFLILRSHQGKSSVGNQSGFGNMGIAITSDLLRRKRSVSIAGGITQQFIKFLDDDSAIIEEFVLNYKVARSEFFEPKDTEDGTSNMEDIDPENMFFKLNDPKKPLMIFSTRYKISPGEIPILDKEGEPTGKTNSVLNFELLLNRAYLIMDNAPQELKDRLLKIDQFYYDYLASNITETEKAQIAKVITPQEIIISIYTTYSDSIYRIQNCPNLQTLKLDNWFDLTDQGMLARAKHSIENPNTPANIQVNNSDHNPTARRSTINDDKFKQRFGRTDNTNNTRISAILENTPHLKKLDIINNPFLTSIHYQEPVKKNIDSNTSSILSKDLTKTLSDNNSTSKTKIKLLDLKEIETLNLTNCQNLQNLQIEGEKLTELNLCGCNNINWDTSMFNCPGLKIIKFAKDANISNTLAYAFPEMFPQLEKIYLGDTVYPAKAFSENIANSSASI